MNSGARKYNTGYKKNGNADRDIYLPRRAPGGLLSCRGCGCIYFRGRWTLDPSREILKRFELRDGVRPAYCPACQKIRDHYWMGVVQISGIAGGEKREIIKLLRNEETRAREKNPLERIVRIVEAANGLRVETTTEKLAQRLGRALAKARGGKIVYQWSHRNKFARVVWEKTEKNKPTA